MNTPLYSKLCDYAEKHYPFHMPGHKYGRGADISEIPIHLLDATEATGLDNLYEAEGIINEAMTLMANFYGALHTIFITNGSTAGILSSILTVCKPGDKIIVARNSHHSVWSALTLAGVQPVYVMPTMIDSIGVMGKIELESIKKAIEEYPDIVGAIIVSPTYEGIVSPIKEIADYLHDKNKLLIVDEAHGAHFVLDDIFPKSSVVLGADLVIQSMHKTLPTLTQSALIHIGTKEIKKDKLVEALRMVQTSSPSYAMMGIMDYTRAYIEENTLVIREYVKQLIEVRQKLKGLANLVLLDGDDPSKIIIDTSRSKISGYELAASLEKEYNIGIEAAHIHHIILISTCADTKEGLQSLVDSLLKIDSKFSKREEPIYKRYKMAQYNNSVTIGISPRDIYYANKTWVSLEKSVGRISAKNIMLYPPGIPVLCVGEKITREMCFKIQGMKDRLLGIEKKNEQILVEVILEEDE